MEERGKIPRSPTHKHWPKETPNRNRMKKELVLRQATSKRSLKNSFRLDGREKTGCYFSSGYIYFFWKCCGRTRELRRANGGSTKIFRNCCYRTGTLDGVLKTSEAGDGRARLQQFGQTIARGATLRTDFSNRATPSPLSSNGHISNPRVCWSNSIPYWIFLPLKTFGSSWGMPKW